MQENIKIIFFDIDKTLTKDNEIISKMTKEYFEKLNKNKYLILVTGRTNIYAIKKSIASSASNIVISDNGALIYDYNKNKILYSSFIKEEDILKIWHLSNKYNIGIVLNTINKKYRNNNSINEGYFDFDNLEITDINELTSKISQIVLFLKDKKDYNTILKELQKLNNIQVSNTGKELDGRYFIDINNKETSKGVAIKHLYKILNINKNNTMSFGDSMNDLSMFLETNIKVAMKNADTNLKEIATYITDYDNNEDGVIKFLEKYFKKK